MMREQMTEKLGSLLSGLAIQTFKLLAGGTVVLYLVRGQAPPSVDQTPMRLVIDSAWRICTSDKVIAGSLDSPDSLMFELRKLTGLTVESVRLDGIPGDIIILLHSGILIESFGRSVEGDQYELRRSDGLRLGLRDSGVLYEALEEPD